jgi:hypothetical protein
MNLPVPTLPTDNLYKFMALSGLAILIISLVFPMIRIEETELKLVELETQTEVLRIETDDLTREMSGKTEKIQKEMVSLDPEKLANLSKKDIELLLNESKLHLQDLENDRKRMNELKIKTVELKGRTKLVGALMEDLRSYLIFLIVGGALGLLFCFLGFGLWYKLVQRPSDLLMKAQVERSRMEQQARQKEAGHGDLS